jgi:hypothetical protein
MGDFYGSRYRRGDPGFFSALGNVFKGVAGSVAGMIPGIGGALSGAISKIGVKAPSAMAPLMKMGKSVGTAIVKHPGITAAGTAALGVGAGALIAGRKAAGAGAVTVGGRRRRRMNPCNPRALRRAIRRAHSFERLAKRVIGFSSPRKPKGHMYFKRKKKR